MKIRVAKTSGFCMGVRNAILKILNEVSDTNEEIFIYGPLIHNPQTIDILTNRGIKTIHKLDDIDNKIITIRTHGVPLNDQAEIEKRSKRVINLTCPRVTKVQKIISKYSGRDYYTIITGDKDHAEVIGLKSFASSGVCVISGIEDIKKIPDAEKYILVTQTTFNKDLFENILNILESRLSNIKVFNTICNSTHNRQEEVTRSIDEGVDAIVVIGGKNSANTKRLAQLGIDKGIKTCHIETGDEIDESEIRNANEVLVTAGASTPGYIINSVLEKLYYIRMRNRNKLINLFSSIFEFLFRANVLTAIMAFTISMVTQNYFGAVLDYKLALLSLLSIFAVSNFNIIAETSYSKTGKLLSYNFLKKYKRLLFSLSIAAFIASFYIAGLYGSIQVQLLAAIYISGLIMPVLNSLDLFAVKKIYRLYSILIAISWIIAGVLIPAIYHNVPNNYILQLLFFIFTLIFMRYNILDMITFQRDLIMGRETLPVIFGIKKMRALLISMALGVVISFSLFSFFSDRGYYIILTLNIVYLVYLFLKIIKMDYIISIKYEFITDLNFILFITLFYLIQ